MSGTGGPDMILSSSRACVFWGPRMALNCKHTGAEAPESSWCQAQGREASGWLTPRAVLPADGWVAASWVTPGGQCSWEPHILDSGWQ